MKSVEICQILIEIHVSPHHVSHVLKVMADTSYHLFAYEVCLETVKVRFSPLEVSLRVLAYPHQLFRTVRGHLARSLPDLVRTVKRSPGADTCCFLQ